jgi:hypothetical protein
MERGGGVARFLRAALIMWSVLLAALILTQVAVFSHGDAGRGERLYRGQGDPPLGCPVCHYHYAIAPPMSGISERVAHMRLTTAENAAKTTEEYLAESILYPARYVVPRYADVMSSTNFSRALSLQDVQDIVAYLMTL